MSSTTVWLCDIIFYRKHFGKRVSFTYCYKRIRDLREDKDKTQREIAEFLNMKPQQYARYESGEREIPLHHLITLAKFYNVSLDYLAGLIPTPRDLF